MTYQEVQHRIDEESRKARLRQAQRRARTQILQEKSPRKRLQLTLAAKYPSVVGDARVKSVSLAPPVPVPIVLLPKDSDPDTPVLPNPTDHIPSLMSLVIPKPLMEQPSESLPPFDPRRRPKVGPQSSPVPRNSPLRVYGCGKCRTPWHDAKACHILRRHCFFCGVWAVDYLSCPICRYLP